MAGNELKPVRCGCGGEAELKHYCYSYGDDDQYYYVWCQRCDIQTKTYRTEAEAIEAWNRAMGIDNGINEWCIDCKEYDLQNACCHRWNRVIATTIDEMKKQEKEERTAKVENQYSIGDHGKVYEYGSCGACSAAVIKPDKYCSECGCILEWR